MLERVINDPFLSKEEKTAQNCANPPELCATDRLRI